MWYNLLVMVFDAINLEYRAKKILLGSYNNNKIASTYLFYGQDVDLIYTVALEFAKLLQCGSACGSCPICKKIDANVHPDVILILPEGKKNIIKIERMRELKERLNIGIYEGKYIVVIVKNIDQIQEEAANSALKILEEPPEKTVFILIASNKESLPKTILSRCQCIYFSREKPMGLKELPLPKNNSIYDLLLFSSSLFSALPKDDNEKRNALLQLLQDYALYFYKNNNYKLSKLVLKYISAIKRNANIKLVLDHFALSLGGVIK